MFKDTRHASALYNMEVGGHLYSRISNPTVAVLEQRLAALGCDGSPATSSGMAALILRFSPGRKAITLSHLPSYMVQM